MFLKSQDKIKRHSSFNQDLDRLKRAPSLPQQARKTAEHYKLIISILDLMVSKYPKIIEQVFILKKSITKWYEHSYSESIARSKQILNMRDNLVVYIKKDLGIVFEEIGMFLKLLTEQYNDGNIQMYYTKYLMALKKLEWNKPDPSKKTQSVEVQTESEQEMSKALPTDKSINMKTESTIEGSSPLKFKDLDIHKYIKIKEENLQLEKKNNQLSSRITELDHQNRNLRQEIDRLMDESMESRQDGQRYLKQIEKLTNILNKIRSDQEQKLRKDKQRSLSFTFTENKYKRQEDLKKCLLETLSNAEEEILKKEQFFQIEQKQRQYNDNYLSSIEQDLDDRFRTIKKERDNILEDSDDNAKLRFMLMQALAIQQFTCQNSKDSWQ